MIVYQATKSQFIRDTFQDDIEFVMSLQYLRSHLGQHSKSPETPEALLELRRRDCMAIIAEMLMHHLINLHGPLLHEDVDYKLIM